MADTRTETPLLIAFVDLSRFFAQSHRTDDSEIAETLDAFYEHVGAASARPTVPWSSSWATPPW